jgi:hypothetical protein
MNSNYRVNGPPERPGLEHAAALDFAVALQTLSVPHPLFGPRVTLEPTLMDYFFIPPQQNVSLLAI